jgi:hypothetical protein
VPPVSSKDAPDLGEDLPAHTPHQPHGDAGVYQHIMKIFRGMEEDVFYFI